MKLDQASENNEQIFEGISWKFSGTGNYTQAHFL